MQPGEEVVCITKENIHLSYNKLYTIIETAVCNEQCKDCNLIVYVGINDDTLAPCRCDLCGTLTQATYKNWHTHRHFAKLQDISELEEILNEESFKIPV